MLWRNPDDQPKVSLILFFSAASFKDSLQNALSVDTHFLQTPTFCDMLVMGHLEVFSYQTTFKSWRNQHRIPGRGTRCSTCPLPCQPAHLSLPLNAVITKYFTQGSSFIPNSCLPVFWIKQRRVVTDFSTRICEAKYKRQKISFKCHRVILYCTFPHPQSSLRGWGWVGEQKIKQSA